MKRPSWIRQAVLSIRIRMIVNSICEHDDEIVKHKQEAMAVARKRDALELKLHQARHELARGRL